MRKHVKERQERLKKIAKQDAANRCRFCRRALPKHPWTLGDALYCNIDCYRDQCDEFGEGI